MRNPKTSLFGGHDVRCQCGFKSWRSAADEAAVLHRNLAHGAAGRPLAARLREAARKLMVARVLDRR